MGHFVVSFRIERDGTYQERYESLHQMVKAISTGYVWDETTSLYIFPAAGDAASVANTLYFQTQLLAPKDTIVVIDPIRSTYAGYGLKYEALLSAAIGMAQLS
ncbi:MAG: hypothetical protein V4787_08135 [Pseudomonadota bacterium]